MVKFEVRVKNEMHDAWQDFYISYKHLKEQFLDDDENCAPEASRDVPLFRSKFLSVIESEIHRADLHFIAILEELWLHVNELDHVFHEATSTHAHAAGTTTTHGTSGAPSTMRPHRTPGLVEELQVAGKRKQSTPLKTGQQGAFLSISEEGVQQTSSSSAFHGFGTGHRIGDTPMVPPQDTHGGFSSVKDLQHQASGEPKTPGSAIVASVKKTFSFDDEEQVKDARHRSLLLLSVVHALQRFCELNREAVRKACKKADKMIPTCFVSGHGMDLFNRSEMALRGGAELESIMHRISVDFQSKFGESLEQFRDGKMAVGEHWHVAWKWVLTSIIVFIAILELPLFAPEHVAAQKCLALFCMVITLWTTEAIPFFVTAMLIPVIAVPLGILADPVTGRPAEPPVAARVMMGRIFDHVQILVLGGLTMAKAISKVHLETVIMDFLHYFLAHRPALFMLGVMAMACYLCAFVSNVASPVLVLGVLQPTLWEMPKGSTAPHAMILGIAISCNLGGMLSPMASPQNAVAMQVLAFTTNMSFIEWVFISFPLVTITLVAAWAILLKVYDPFKTMKFIPLHIPKGQGGTAVGIHSLPSERPKGTMIVVLTCFLTIVLWCIPNTPFGDTGIVALIPVIVFYGVGILKKEDFNALSWHLLFLLAGGNMLGTCTRDSKLLELATQLLQSHLEGWSPYAVYCLIISVVGFVTTFVSHTVAAILMLPVIAKVGMSLATTTAAAGAMSWLTINASLLVFGSVLMCSGAMAFPITSFPNVNSLLAEDEQGHPYLKARDFLIPGSSATLLCYLGLITYMVPLMAWVL